MFTQKSNSKVLMAGIIFIIALLVCISPATVAQENVTINILTINDFHGALLEEGKNPGAAELAGFFKTEKENNPDGTLILSAGDMFQGTAESNMLNGQPVLDIMNEIGFDAMTVGNHEFDWGIETLDDLSSKAKFSFLSANIAAKNPLNLMTFAKPYVIIEKNGIKVGIIGLTTLASAYTVKPAVISDFIFNDLAETVNSYVPILKREGAEIIIALGHIGSAMTESSEIEGEAADFAAKVRGVDAIISGHTHLQVAGKVNGIPIVQAGYNGRAAGKISLIYSKKDKKIIESKVDVISMQDSKFISDTKIQSILDNSLRGIVPVKNEKLGTAVNELSHSREECSVLGQWVSDVLRKKFKADIAFQNGGGLRTSIPRGKITMGRIYEMVPFDNNIVTLDMTGSQIMKVLEHGIYNKNISMLQYSGLNVVYDRSVTNKKVFALVTTLDGKKLDLKKTYRVVTIDYLADGGDGYNMFREGKNIEDTFILERDILIDAVKSAKFINFKGDGRFRDQQAKVA